MGSTTAVRGTELSHSETQSEVLERASQMHHTVIAAFGGFHLGKPNLQEFASSRRRTQLPLWVRNTTFSPNRAHCPRSHTNGSSHACRQHVLFVPFHCSKLNSVNPLRQQNIFPLRTTNERVTNQVMNTMSSCSCSPKQPRALRNCSVEINAGALMGHELGGKYPHCGDVWGDKKQKQSSPIPIHSPKLSHPMSPPELPSL